MQSPSHPLMSPNNLNSPAGISFPGKRNSKIMAAKQYSFGQKTMTSIINALHKIGRRNNIYRKEETKDSNLLDDGVYDLNEEELLNVCFFII